MQKIVSPRHQLGEDGLLRALLALQHLDLAAVPTEELGQSMRLVLGSLEIAGRIVDKQHAQATVATRHRALDELGCGARRGLVSTAHAKLKRQWPAGDMGR